MNKDLNPSIDYQLRTNLNPLEPSDFVTSITGDVSVYSDDGPEEEPVIAKVHYYHLAQMEQERGLARAAVAADDDQRRSRGLEGVDQPLDNVHGLGPTGAAIGRGGHRIGKDRL